MSAITGQNVQYVSSEGHRKMAFVIATPEDIADDAPEGVREFKPEEGHAHLIVFSLMAGAFIPRLNVPSEEMAESIPDYKIDGKLVGYYKEV